MSKQKATKQKPPKQKTAKADRDLSMRQTRICNLLPSRDTDKDWRFADAMAAGLLTAKALPKSVDLRQSWWGANNQGGTGSCVGWACADGVLRAHLVEAGKLSEQQLLSPRFVWMASKETDAYNVRPQTFIEEAGTTLKAAMDVIRKYGCVLEEDLPFAIDTHMYKGPERGFYAKASTRKAANYFNLALNFNEWKSWLANHGPILAGLNVDDTWDDAAKTQGKLDKYKAKTAYGGHAVAIVGYSGDRFIIRNSWGTSWGDQGFAYASTDYVKAAFFEESYGITLSA
jgi:C1A family cysteine protease